VTATIVVRQSVREHVQKEIVGSLLNSTATFQNFEREHELSLTHSAELLANLPSLKALMTTQHAATIQDASTDLWRLGGSDLFLLADRTGKVVALHATTPLFSRLTLRNYYRTLSAKRTRDTGGLMAGISTRSFSDPSFLAPCQTTAHSGFWPWAMKPMSAQLRRLAALRRATWLLAGAIPSQ